METGIKETLNGYQVWFRIGHQSFSLQECEEDTKEESFESAQFFEKMLLKALNRKESKTGAEKTLEWFEKYVQSNGTYPLVAEIQSQLKMAVDEEK